MVITVGPHSASGALQSESDEICIGLEDLDILMKSNTLGISQLFPFLATEPPRVRHCTCSACKTGAVSAHALILLFIRVNSRARVVG